ncbi:MAG: hypothetical protein M1826_006537 [Phylliscum demangeonii]|nr:MAG: hypothetical protein M1826_006537 [Phylliscum demangeonii]
MRLSWCHLALLVALPAVVVAVTPPQFTYDGLVTYLREAISEKRSSFCRPCMLNCIKSVRSGGYLHRNWPDKFPYVPESQCAEKCYPDLQDRIRGRLRQAVDQDLPRELERYVRGLPAEDQRQATLEASNALKRAVDDVGTDHPDVECKHSDSGMPPQNPNSPENSAALKKGSTHEKNNIVPYTRKSSPPSGPSSSTHRTGSPSARDNWATEEPYHTPLKIDPICGFTPPAARRRCRYKPLHQTQPQQQQPAQPGQPLAIPAIPGTAPVLEPFVAPGLGPAADSALLLLKGGV